MARVALRGIDGSSPLGFLAALGLLRLASVDNDRARLGFTPNGSFRAFFDETTGDLAKIVTADAARATHDMPWLLRYEKVEKNGARQVMDLKAPPAVFREFACRSIEAWRKGEQEGAGYAAAFGTTVAVDGKGNTKPTAFHFTAANQQFLGTVKLIRGSVTEEWVRASLFEGHARRPGSNLRWDPTAERNWALMASNPNTEGTSVDAPIEWLAFRALPFLPSFPRGSRILTTGVTGRGEHMEFSWPLWQCALTAATVQSVLQASWSDARERSARGIFAICTSSIRRTSQGFGNFGPATITI